MTLGGNTKILAWEHDFNNQWTYNYTIYFGWTTYDCRVKASFFGEHVSDKWVYCTAIKKSKECFSKECFSKWRL